MGENEILPALSACVFCLFHSDTVVYTTCPHKFIDSEFRETLLGDSHTSLAGVN